MPDPVDALPYEIWIWCIAFSIDGRHAGPQELLAVSRRWGKLLLETPSLWTQIYIQNGEDEIFRISTFLSLSGKCSLHVNILTSVPTRGLHLIAEHISRVTTISIMPGPLDTVTALHMGRWKQASSHILTILSNGRALHVKSASCFGISLRENGQLFYSIVLMQFAMATAVRATDEQNYITSAELPVMSDSGTWEEQVTRYAFLAHWCHGPLSNNVTQSCRKGHPSFRRPGRKHQNGFCLFNCQPGFLWYVVASHDWLVMSLNCTLSAVSRCH